MKKPFFSHMLTIDIDKSNKNANEFANNIILVGRRGQKCLNYDIFSVYLNT